MSIFSKKQKGFLGIDFGAAGIKVVQLTKKGDKAALFTYGFSESAAPSQAFDYTERSEEARENLKAICKKARATTVQAVAALPMPAVFSAVLSIAPVSKKEMRQAVEWEAKKLIPLPLEKMTIDFKELPGGGGKDLKNAPSGRETKEEKKDKSGSERAVEILLTAAPKDVIAHYIAITRGADLNLTSLETEAFAIIRSLLGDDPSACVIVDIGAVRSNIIIVEGGVPMFTRSIEVGGAAFTEALAKSLAVSAPEAEIMKRDWTSAGAAGGKILPPPAAEALRPLISEMHYSLNTYQSRNSGNGRMPDKIILTGGGAELAGIADFFAAEFNLRAFLGNPWQRIDYHPDLAPVLEKIGSRFSVAIGLALRNL